MQLKPAILIFFISGNAMALCPGYQYQRVLTINAAKVSTGTLTYTNFPALFQDTDVALSTASSGGHLFNANAYDLIFSTNPNGFPLINWDTETFNNTGSTQDNIFIRVPTISSSTNTTIYMCYGNAAITSYQGISTGTWDANYLAVYHFGGTSNGGAVKGIDSTVNAQLATTVHLSTESLSGEIDGAATFIAATTSFITIPASLQSVQLPMTFEVLYFPYTVSSSVDNFFLSDASGSNATKQFRLDAGTLTASFSKTGCAGTQPFFYSGSGNPDSLNTWHYAGFVTSGTVSSPLLSIYLDGNAPQAFTPTAFNSTYCGGPNLSIGSAGTPEFSFDGLLDEIRISNSSRSQDWIKTSYNSETSPSTFITIGNELGGPLLPLTINGTVRMRGGQTFL